jgi:dynein heavy chain 1
MALRQLNEMKTKVESIKRDRDSLEKAKQALELSSSDGGESAASVRSPLTDRLDTCLEELHDLEGVLKSLAELDTQVDELRERPWMSVQPRKVRATIDTLMSDMKELPAKYRTYDAYEAFKRKLQNHAKVVADLI